MSGEPEAKVPQAELRTLAEFRYQLRRFLNFSEMATEQRGIAAQQYQLMQAIAAVQEGQQASISYLAERMVLRHNSTVELVDRAERAGMVRREPDEKDLRRSLVRLTTQGERMLQELALEHLKELAPRCDHLIRALQELQRASKGGGAPAER
jgi:DNA-binding MarR family transcriptional regulator